MAIDVLNHLWVSVFAASFVQQFVDEGKRVGSPGAGVNSAEGAMSVMHGFVSCNLCGATFSGHVVPPHACLHSLPQPPVDIYANQGIVALQERCASLERELAEARAQSLSVEMERRDLWKALAAARAEVKRLHGALAASNNDEDVCCHGVGFDEDCDDCEHADTEDGRALPEERREGRGVDVEPSPAALSPKTAAQTSGRHAGTAPGYRVGTDGRAVSHEAAQAADLPEPYSAEVGLQRHIEQAHAISSLLSEAGVGPCSLPEGVRLLMNDRDRLADALAAERIENAHLREAFVTMEKAYNEAEAALAALNEQRCETCRYQTPDDRCSMHDSRLRDDGSYEYVPCADFGHCCGAWARREP